MSESTARSRTYVVGDLHGRLDLLHDALHTIQRHAAGSAHRLLFLGDYVDRGPESRNVIESLMELQGRMPVVCLKGNHEELMLQALAGRISGAMRRWLHHGGEATLRSYDVSDPDKAASVIPASHVRWLSGLPLTTGDSHRIYVHAGLLPRTPMHRQSEQTCLWIRERFLRARDGEFEAHVVHGHTPLWEGKPDPAEPELLAHRTNLDTGAFSTGVLAIGVFQDDKTGGPVEVIKVTGSATGDLVSQEAASSATRGDRQSLASRLRRLTDSLR